jgi:hypothetical protein
MGDKPTTKEIVESIFVGQRNLSRQYWEAIKVEAIRRVRGWDDLRLIVAQVAEDLEDYLQGAQAHEFVVCAEEAAVMAKRLWAALGEIEP